MGGLSWWHWLIIIGAFVLLFGAKKLPDAARGVGRSLRILKSEVAAMNEDGHPTTAASTEVPVTPVPAPPLTAPPLTVVPPTVVPLTVVPAPAAGAGVRH